MNSLLRTCVGFVLLLSLAFASTLDVFAAASLKESFSTIAKEFERINPGCKVHLTFAGSQQLAAQIQQGAECDVFASADERNLSKISTVPGTHHVFARNQLVLVLARSQSRIRRLEDLVAAQRIVLANRAVPVGQYSREALNALSRRFGPVWLRHVESNVVSEEQDVRAVLTKVVLGEADAGFVYQTDAMTVAGKVRTIGLPREVEPIITYPVGVPTESRHPALAAAFIRLLASPFSRGVLKKAGFVF